MGGAAWSLTKLFQTVGPVLPQRVLQAGGPEGNTAAVQVCGGRGDFWGFFSFFSDSWSVRSWKMDALSWSLCLAQATVEAGTAGNGLQGTLCSAAGLRFPLELFQATWLYSWGTVGKTRSQEVIKSHYYYLLLVNIYAMVMSGGASQAVSPSLFVSTRPFKG